MKKNNKKLKNLSSLGYSYIPRNLLPAVSNYFSLDFIPTAYKCPLLTDIIDTNIFFWNHIISRDNNCNYKILPIAQCKDIFFNSLVFRKILSNLSSSSFHTVQVDMTLMKISNGFIYISSDDATVKSFCLSCPRISYTSSDHLGGVWAFDTDGSILVTGSTDKSVKLYKINENFSLSLFKSVKLHKSTVRAITLTDSFIFSASRDASVIVYDRNLEFIASFNDHIDSIRAIDANDRYLVTGSYDHTVNLYSLPSPTFVCRLQRHSQRIYVVKLFRNYVAASGISGEIQITNLSTRETVAYNVHHSITIYLDFVENHLVSSSVNGLVTKYNYIDRKVCWQFATNYAIKAQKVWNGLVVIGTINTCDVYEYETGRFISRILNNVIVTKIDMNDRAIVVGVNRFGTIVVEVFEWDRFINV